MSIPNTMRAAMVTAPGRLEIREVPVPGLWDDRSILIKTDITTVCNLTDRHLLDGALVHNGPVGTNQSKDPYILGHEICGTVLQKGSAVTDVGEGDRVSIRGWFASGGYADYVVTNCDYLKIPDDMSVETGALLEMAAAVWLIVEQVMRLGDSVALLGHGGAGNYFRKMLKAAGCTKLIVSEPHPAKRAHALEHGADHVIDPHSEDVVTRVEELTGGLGVDVCIDACGEPDSINLMSRLPRRRGKVGMFGVPTEPVPDGNFFWIHEKALAVFSGGYHYDYTEIAHRKVLDLVTSGVIDLSDMVTHRISLEELPATIDAHRRPESDIRKAAVIF